MPPHPKALAVELRAEHQAGHDEQENPHSQHGRPHCSPGSFVSEVRHKEQRSDLVADRQGQDQSREHVVALPPGLECGNDQEQDHQVVVAVMKVAQDWPQAANEDGHLDPRRQRTGRRPDDLEAEPDRDPRQRRLDDEPAERAGNWRQAHQGVERQWHDRRIGEHLRVVDIHTADELEYLGPPTDEGALAIFGFLDVVERRNDGNHQPADPDSVAERTSQGGNDSRRCDRHGSLLGSCQSAWIH